MIQWLYETIYTAVGEMFADINNLGIEIFDLSWVQAVVRLFTLLGWTLFVVGVVVAVFDLGIECQTGRANIKGTFLNVLKGFFAASLVGVLPVQLYKLCCSLQALLTVRVASKTAPPPPTTSRKKSAVRSPSPRLWLPLSGRKPRSTSSTFPVTSISPASRLAPCPPVKPR